MTLKIWALICSKVANVQTREKIKIYVGFVLAIFFFLQHWGLNCSETLERDKASPNLSYLHFKMRIKMPTQQGYFED
jgi:hypothetical protein